MIKTPRYLFMITFLSLAALSACGQKGPLYLPGDPSQIQTIPEIEERLEEDDEDDEEEQESERNSG